MCGIFGIYSASDFLVRDIAERISHSLQHRGPDDFGAMFTSHSSVAKHKVLPEKISTNLLMLHYRLSILDLSDLGWQPMSCESGNLHLVFNGEIYNYRELRIELSQLGHQFKSESDTEVLLKAFKEWGKNCLAKLIGMFAFAIFDTRESKLFLARDFFGIKPLYYVNSAQQFIFASEIKAILQLPIAKQLNVDRAFYYLRYGLTDFGDETLLTDIYQLPAGHYLEIGLNNLSHATPMRYFQLIPHTISDITYPEAVTTMRQLFLESMQLHLRSDVPIGTALSGGIDSSSIVMAMRHLHPQLELHTFSYIAEGSEWNEEKWIDIVAEKANAISHKVSFDQSHLIEDLENLIRLHDEPFGSTSIYAQYRVFQLTKQHGIKVMLDGQGADEMLAGYAYYRAARLASLLKSGKLLQLMHYLWNMKHYGRSQIMVRSMQYLLPPQLQIFLRPLVSKEYMPPWINKAWFQHRRVGVMDLKTKYSKQVLQQDLLHSLETSSLPMLLRYEDRNSMFHSIESRVPFLTPQLASFIFSLPEQFLIDEKGRSKAVFRDAMRGIVPDDILNRKDKIGFATPEKTWLRTLQPWVDQCLNSDYVKQLPVFNHPGLIREWQAMLNNKAPFDFRFWRWINFIKWSELNDIHY